MLMQRNYFLCVVSVGIVIITCNIYTGKVLHHLHSALPALFCAGIMPALYRYQYPGATQVQA